MLKLFRAFCKLSLPQHDCLPQILLRILELYNFLFSFVFKKVLV